MKALIVSAVPARGRYRAGHHFLREPSIVEVDDAQEEAIRRDPLLRVHEAAPKVVPVEIDEAPEEPKKGKR